MSAKWRQRASMIPYFKASKTRLSIALSVIYGSKRAVRFRIAPLT